MKAICKKELKSKHVTFRKGELYEFEKINDNWNLVEAVGVNPTDFNNYFEVQ